MSNPIAQLIMCAIDPSIEKVSSTPRRGSVELTTAKGVVEMTLAKG